MGKAETIDMSAVDETLTQIISNWPSLHTTRYSALENALTSSWPSWQETETGFVPRPSGIADGRDKMEDPTVQFVADIMKGRTFEQLSSWERAEVFSRRVAWGRRHAMEVFNREHAADIARDTSASFEGIPSFSLSDIEKIPLDSLDPAWRAALVEYCRKVECVSDDKVRAHVRDRNKEAQDRALSELRDSKAAAKECLFRLGLVSDKDAAERAAVIAKLRAQAAAFGLDLVERSANG